MNEERDEFAARGVEIVGSGEAETSVVVAGEAEETEAGQTEAPDCSGNQLEEIPENTIPTGEAEYVRVGDLKEIIELIRSAEKEAFERGVATERRQREEQLKAELEATRNIWHNERLEEAEMERKREIQAGEAFLSRIRPSVWDR